MSKMTPARLGLLAGICLLFTVLSLVLLLPTGAESSGLENTYYTVTAQSDNEAYGMVEVKPSNYQNEEGQYLYGTTVTLVAKPATGYEFVQWVGGNTESPSNPLEVIVGSEAAGYVYSYTAYFQPIRYEIVLVYDKTVQYEYGKGLPKYHTYGQTTQLPNPISDSGYRFKGWIANSVNIENKFYAPNSSLGANEYEGTIYLTPKFEPIPYTVRCLDVTQTGQLLNDSVLIESYFGATVSPLDAVESQYRGYYFDPSSVTELDSIVVTGNSNENVVKRVYRAKTFKIIYKNCEKQSETFTYGVSSTITKPNRVGYDFAGWTVENYNDAAASYMGFREVHLYDGNSLEIPADAYDHADWTYETRDSDALAIVLVARWTPQSFSISYEDDDGVGNRTHFSSFPATRIFDESLTLEAPVRAGYTFVGWKVKGSDAEPVPSITLCSEATNLTLVACWTVNSYQVTLNGGADDAILGDESITVTFDQAVPQIAVHPTREGYTFIGFYFHGDHQSVTPYYYLDSDTGVWVGATWDIPNDATLYAHWKVNSYTVEFDSAFLENVTVTVDGQPYVEGHPFIFDFDTSIEIAYTVKEGYKLVSWNGAAVTHADSGVFSHTVKGAVVFNGSVAPELTAPAFRVNYSTERFSVNEDGSIPAGSYRLVCGDTVVSFTVGVDGVISFGDGKTDSRLSAEAYFGKTVKLYACGDGMSTADSDGTELILATRPAAPERNTDIKSISAYNYSIEIVMLANGIYTYEYAVSTQLFAAGEGLSESEWSPNGKFENLKAGTPYYVYIRVAASETYPHGQVFVTDERTLSKQYLQEMINQVRALKQADDGDQVNKLINDAVLRMEALETSAKYVENMEAILESVKDGINFARLQDTALGKLKEQYDILLASGLYSEGLGLPMLHTIYQGSVAEVVEATAPSEIQRIWDNSQIQFKAVPISYLRVNEELLLTFDSGMDRDYKLAMARISDLVTISTMIERAVAAQNIVIAGTQMTLAEAPAILGSMDVVGYYQLQLTHSNAASAAKPQGTYEIRLLIPEDLRDEAGLLVAYYQTGTDQITVLDSRREGNYLIFTADSVANFVILGDHTVDLTGILIALAAMVTAQLIAICLLLARRSKAAAEVKARSLALPVVALTVRFLPANMLSVVLILGAAAVLLQILLLWLLLKSNVVARQRFAKHFESPDSSPADLSEEYPTLTVVSDEEGADAVEPLYEEFGVDASEGDYSSLPSDEPEEEPYEADYEGDPYGEDDLSYDFEETDLTEASEEGDMEEDQ